MSWGSTWSSSSATTHHRQFDLSLKTTAHIADGLVATPETIETDNITAIMEPAMKTDTNISLTDEKRLISKFFTTPNQLNDIDRSNAAHITDALATTMTTVDTSNITATMKPVNSTIYPEMMITNISLLEENRNKIFTSQNQLNEIDQSNAAFNITCAIFLFFIAVSIAVSFN